VTGIFENNLLVPKLLIGLQIPWITNNVRGYNKNKIRLKRESFTTDFTEIQRIII
jgi:hypothetical protein